MHTRRRCISDILGIFVPISQVQLNEFSCFQVIFDVLKSCYYQVVMFAKHFTILLLSLCITFQKHCFMLYVPKVHKEDFFFGLAYFLCKLIVWLSQAIYLTTSLFHFTTVCFQVGFHFVAAVVLSS